MLWLLDSLKNLVRYREKYRPFAVLYILLVTVLAVCLNTYVTMERVTERLISEYAGLVRIVPRVSSSEDQLTLRSRREDYLALSELEGVERAEIYKYTFITNALGGGFKEVTKTLTVDGEARKWGGAGTPLVVYGYEPRLMHLELGAMELEAGRLPESDGEAVIRKNELLEPCYGPWLDWNDLQIGDAVTLECGGIEREYELVGILAGELDATEKTFKYELFTTLSGAECFDSVALETKWSFGVMKSGESEIITAGHDAVLYLDSPEDFLEVRRELSRRGHFGRMFFSDAGVMLNLLQTMQLWCVLFLVIIGVVILGTVIISTSVLLRARRCDIAILRSIGMSKLRLILGQIIENVAFVLGTTGVALLAAQLLIPSARRKFFAGVSEMVSDETIVTLLERGSAGVNLTVAGLVAAAMLTTTLVSLAITARRIVRLEPLKLLGGSEGEG